MPRYFSSVTSPGASELFQFLNRKTPFDSQQLDKALKEVNCAINKEKGALADVDKVEEETKNVFDTERKSAVLVSIETIQTTN